MGVLEAGGVGANSPIIHSRLAHSMEFHSRVVPETQKNIGGKIVLLQAKIGDTPYDQIFLRPSKVGVLQCHIKDRQTDKHTDRHHNPD